MTPLTNQPEQRPDAGTRAEAPGSKGKKKAVQRYWKAGLGVAVAVFLLFLLFSGGDESTVRGTTVEVQKGDLPITVLEGGNVEALERQVIKSQVRGETKILSIVDEGYLVTPEDVKNGKILVELDDAELEEEMTEAEIALQNAEAQLTEAREQYEIQVKQNESDVMAAELKAKFARLEFEKFLGESLANSIIRGLGLNEIEAEIRSASRNLDRELQRAKEKLPKAESDGEDSPQAPETMTLTEDDVQAITDALQDKGMEASQDMVRSMLTRGGTQDLTATPEIREQLANVGVDLDEILAESTEQTAKEMAKGAEALPETTGYFDAEYVEQRNAVDFSKYAAPEKLEDGASKQELRSLIDSRLLAEEELRLAETQLEGSERLAEKDFVTQNELDNDMMAVQRAAVKLEQAETAYDLYVKYEFPKQSEQLLSDYEEALRSLERVQKRGVSELAEAESRLRSREAEYKLRLDRRNEREEQLTYATIRAERPGMVVYGNQNSRRSNQIIAEGETVREQQEIIIIPDMANMGVNIKVHETAVRKVEAGQRATIRVDSFPDEVLYGEVKKVGVLPDSENRWLNPDLKVYETLIAINGQHNWLKPGMSAEVQIIVDHLEDVTYVPLQAVRQNGNSHVAYVAGDNGPQVRQVETGLFNNEYIHVATGLNPGEQVYLTPPDQLDMDMQEEIIRPDQPMSEQEPEELAQSSDGEDNTV